MKNIVISGRAEEINNLQHEFKEQGLEFDLKEKKELFLPSPYKEIIIALTPILVNILYKYLKKTPETEINIKVDNIEMELTTETIKKLNLKLESKESTQEFTS